MYHLSPFVCLLVPPNPFSEWYAQAGHLSEQYGSWMMHSMETPWRPTLWTHSFCLSNLRTHHLFVSHMALLTCIESTLSNPRKSLFISVSNKLCFLYLTLLCLAFWVEVLHLAFLSLLNLILLGLPHFSNLARYGSFLSLNAFAVPANFLIIYRYDDLLLMYH